MIVAGRKIKKMPTLFFLSPRCSIMGCDSCVVKKASDSQTYGAKGLVKPTVC